MVEYVTTTKESYIDVYQYEVKRSNQLTCIGWIKQPSIPNGDPLILLAVSNKAHEVLNVDDSLRIELIKDGTDYRLQYANALSKNVNKTVGVNLNDTKWHFLSYVCASEGQIKFYVDGLYVPPENGMGPSGIPYSTAWSFSARVGGGDVWAPYLYTAGQAVSLYNWRMGIGFQIDQAWLKQLMDIDAAVLTDAQQQ